MPAHGDFIVYVDESGDHGLTRINDEYPLFVLAFCIFRIDEYVEHVVPRVQRLKFDFFGHDMCVFHEMDIRKSRPPFDILRDADIRVAFIKRINALVALRN